MVPQRVGGQYASAPGQRGGRFDQTLRTTTVESKMGGGPRSPGGEGRTMTSTMTERYSKYPGTSNVPEQVSMETTRSLQSGPPRKGQFGINDDFIVNRYDEFISKDGKVLGRQPKPGENYGFSQDFIINDKRELLGRDGQILGRILKPGHGFAINTEVIVNANGEYVTKDGKIVGRRPASGDYTVNEKGQYILGNGIILDHAPDSGEYMINEFGEFISSNGKVSGPSLLRI